MEYRTHIHGLDDDSLLQVFSCYRLEEEDNWYLQLGWLKLVQVSQRWRYLIYNSCSHLDLCLLLTSYSPSIHTPNHLPPLPLVIYHSDRTRTMVRRDEDNIHLGLQQYHGRVRQVVLQAPSLSLSMWLELMNKVFPRLKVLSLLSTTIEETNLMLPETLQAPDLRSLVLHGIGLPRGLTLLSSSITLSTITLTHIGVSCYFTPGELVTKLQSLPHLEELSIGFAIPIPLPSSERNLLPAPILSVTLHALRQLTFRGLDIYLDNLIAQINTPLLERLYLALFFDPLFTLVNLTEFIHRTKAFRSLVARVSFNNNGASIDFGKLNLFVNCEPLDWKIDSATQVCNTLGKVLSIVEELTVDLNKDGMLSGWEDTLDSIMWHELLLPFIGVKKLCIGTSITLELSRALGSAAGGLVLGFLPELQELEVHLEIDRAKALSSFLIDKFLKTRKSVGRPVDVVSSGPNTAARSPPQSPPEFPKPNASAPGSHYQHHATQAATGTTHPTAYGSQVPASPWVPGMPMGYDSSRDFQQPHMGQSPRGPPYSQRLADEPDPPYPLGFARQQGSGSMTPPWTPIQGPAGGANAFGGSHPHQSAAPNAFRGSHSQQSVNNEPYHVGFIRPSNSGPNRSPPQFQGPIGGANAFGGSHSQQSVNNEPYHVGFIRPSNLGPNRSPPQGHGGMQNTSRGPHPAGRARKRKAVVIGTNYSTHPDHRFRLRSCTEDAYGMANFICSKLGFARHDVRLMTDEAEYPRNLPTKNNILDAMRALVYDAQPGDTFFFYFSGHGVQIKDLDGDEADGQDECICPIEYRADVPNSNPNTPGLIVDDVIHDILVRPLPRGCRLTALFDSCHSGTALDLPYEYDSRGLVKPFKHQDRSWLLHRKASHADVVSLCASRDNQEARETRLGGALRCVFIECVGSRAFTYRELLQLVQHTRVPAAAPAIDLLRD